MKTSLLFAAACAFSFAAVIDARADEPYPAKPVRIIVPYPAGGVADLLPRTVGQKLSDKWGQPVVVENKPGASGNIGMAEGARAAADGYTIVLAPTGNLTVNQFLFSNLPFDAAKDFTPITVLATSPNVLVVHPSVPAKTFRELVDYAKANPGKLNFASPGEGSGAHLAGELLNIEAGIKTTHIPYKGMAPAVTDLLGGQVQMMFAGISTVLQHIKSGKLVALAIASPQRTSRGVVYLELTNRRFLASTTGVNLRQRIRSFEQPLRSFDHRRIAFDQRRRKRKRGATSPGGARSCADFGVGRGLSGAPPRECWFDGSVLAACVRARK